MARELRITRTQEEIDDVLNKCVEAEAEGSSQWPGMSYEQGVKAAIDWLTGRTSDNPVSE